MSKSSKFPGKQPAKAKPASKNKKGKGAAPKKLIIPKIEGQAVVLRPELTNKQVVDEHELLGRPVVVTRPGSYKGKTGRIGKVITACRKDPNRPLDPPIRGVYYTLVLEDCYLTGVRWEEFISREE